ncbi:MAG: PFL family protein [Gemmatimonadetes bacterium]|nr:PFL family protein [Gemmatimonadota bacterium]
MSWSRDEILETVRMLETEHLDIRTVTLGISLLDCAGGDAGRVCHRVAEKISSYAANFVHQARRVEADYGIPIANKRISITPAAIFGAGLDADGFVRLAETLDRVAEEIGVDYLGGFSALVHKGFSRGDLAYFEALAEALATTKRVCASVNVATTTAGINMDAIARLGTLIKDLAERTRGEGGIGCAKLVVFANAPDDNPFVAGTFHGVGEAECAVNVGVSGPGVVRAALTPCAGIDLGSLAEVVKRTAFKITRLGEMIGRRVAERLGVDFGIVDVSLAPTPAAGDSVADILELIGIERTGAPGTTAALALLTDAVKKGGAMATSATGGLSGAFIPVSEDQGMIRAVREGALSLEKLEAMSAVCSVGLDMVAVPGDTPASTISGIIADEIAIGVINFKTTAVRILPLPGMKAGESVDYGGLLGEAPAMPVNPFRCDEFVARGGRIPPPIRSMKN